jgi:putative transposase
MLFMRHTSEMDTSDSLYHGHRFPAEISSYCVWLYFRISLSLPDVEEILAMIGVALIYETVREWYLKFGQSYATQLPLSWRSMASGRYVSKDKGTPQLPPAGSRSGRRSSRELVQSRRDKKAA